MAISESIQLLGGNLYKNSNIPSVLTISAIPTSLELEYVTAENFHKTMIEKILPYAVKEKINFYDLLEVDYHWLLRCLRILNYGPYYTTNVLYCDNCGGMRGDYRVNLNNINCIPIPDTFTGEALISRDEFLDYSGDVKVRLLTVKDFLNASEDKAFMVDNDAVNRKLARLCYSITELSGQRNLTPLECKIIIEDKFSPADYIILQQLAKTATDFGIRAGGSTTCPKCGSTEATFMALIDDRYFRPTMDDLRAWKNDRLERSKKDTTRNKTKDV